MKISCDKATAICDKSQYGEVTIWERITLSLHLFMCKKCGLYSKQNKLMTKCYEKNKEFGSNKKCCLTEEEKIKMDSNLKEKI